MSEENVTTENVTPEVPPTEVAPDLVSPKVEVIPPVLSEEAQAIADGPVEYYFESAKVVNVLEVLPDGTRLAEMSDGTTKHVPANIFN